MKKLLLTSCLLAGIATISIGSANAIELKAPGVAAVTKGATTSASSDKSAANEAFKKKYQEQIDKQKKALDTVIAYDKASRLELAKVILTDEENAEIAKLTGEEQDKKLDECIIATLTNETFPATYAEWDQTQKDKYLDAIKKIAITSNRYKNVSNQLTAPLKAIVDGDISMISTKDELKNAASMILGIKKDLGSNSDVKKAMNKANKAINKASKEAGGTDVITVVVPDEERVVYPPEGVIGTINHNLDNTNHEVQKASQKIVHILISQETTASLAAIDKNKDLDETEKQAEKVKIINEAILTGMQNGDIKKKMDSLSDAEKKEYQEAVGTAIGAVKNYGEIALECTKLGFNISRNPLIAAPLVFEVGALKDTASLAKASASDLTKLISQVKKVNKECGITIEKPVSENAKAGNIKSVGLKGLKK